MNVGVKLGSRNTYSMLAVGGDDDRLFFGGGLGVHAPRGGYYLDIDALSYAVVDHSFEETEDDMLSQLRVALGLDVTSGISIFGGAQLSAGFAFGDKRGSELSAFDSKTIERDDYVVRVTPGLFAGISVH
jgi:hypothetical protein